MLFYQNKIPNKTPNNTLTDTDTVSSDYDMEKGASLLQRLKSTQEYLSSKPNEATNLLSENKNSVSR